jgi:hypothetical protein
LGENILRGTNGESLKEKERKKRIDEGKIEVKKG